LLKFWRSLSAEVAVILIRSLGCLCTESESIMWGLESPWIHILGLRLFMTANMDDMFRFAFIFLCHVYLFVVFFFLHVIANIVELLIVFVLCRVVELFP
jgi:formate/nitrite transporter FocA (FNT family)